MHAKPFFVEQGVDLYQRIMRMLAFAQAFQTELLLPRIIAAFFIIANVEDFFSLARTQKCFLFPKS
jgi:hypothetical protein